MFWISIILICRFVPAVNRSVGLDEIILPIAVTGLAGLASILSWALGSGNPNALAALQLVEEGKLDLDAPAASYAPAFAELQVLAVAHDLDPAVPAAGEVEGPRGRHLE